MNIINQPSEIQGRNICAAYRPIVFDVEYLDAPSVAYCDIYFNGIFYKTLSKTNPEYSKVFRFDISDASQEYLKSELPPINGSALTTPIKHFVSCFCKFRAGHLDPKGFIKQESPIPVQGTSTTNPVGGGGIQSFGFYILNAVLQHENNQNLKAHLESINNINKTGNILPLSHRPKRYKLCKNDSDYFPVWSDSVLEVKCIEVKINKKDGTFEMITDCLYGEWFPRNPVCELDSNHLRTGTKYYLQRELIWNSVQMLLEENTMANGVGPYFPPVIDHVMCEPQLLKLFDFVVIRYRWTTESGRDLDTLSGFIDTGTVHDKKWVGWSKGREVPESSGENGYIRWGGDNTGTGVESILVNFKKMAEDNPSLPLIKIQFNAFWYSEKKTGNVEIQLETYLGGTMVRSGTDFINTGGRTVQSLILQRNVVERTQRSDINTSTNVAYVTYNPRTKNAHIV